MKPNRACSSRGLRIGYFELSVGELDVDMILFNMTKSVCYTTPLNASRGSTRRTDSKRSLVYRFHTAIHSGGSEAQQLDSVSDIDRD